ncbi:UDP-N-acetylglucosamine 2-epimerase [Solimicrobium silvestre]|uniref:UDP-N-acetyl-D-glucosamine 2-epimerase, UDP-hydrolysing n=1 Tax=Solimicrobium silvestre TaxID=2099400 RepID=A0A2S9GUR7_9BURK|nr:UDP-N-acetylglucosamine 2-epimerase [Solimicrobium silvestre]PRC91477.1 UDP-N-acetyl-D-glucosamine 2-epimerase, UDP-hydrolysing [Solimicrobium silvestre]
MKKILALTSIRSDYDLMSGLYELLNADPEIDLQLLVSGAHLSATFGTTVELIKKDGFKILIEIESLINADTQKSRLKTASILLQNAIDVVAGWQPDLILFAGDREDVLVGAMLGVFLAIPTVHFFGGDHEKDGHADTAVRHATSKLATFHVVSIEQHKQRLMKMGESAQRIAVVGSIALDKFVQLSSKKPIQPSTIFPPDKSLNNYALVIYHPIAEGRYDTMRAGIIFSTILSTLKKMGIPAIVSYPNSDPGNHLIIEQILKHETDPDFWFYKNLERDVFLSLFKQAQFLIGNSSSGILEAASLPLSVINVGERQKGRYCGNNVVFCGNEASEIEQAVNLVMTPDFQASMMKGRNPYGDGNSCKTAYALIKSTDFNQILKKTEDPLELAHLEKK